MGNVASVIKKQNIGLTLSQQMDYCPTVVGRQRAYVEDFLNNIGIEGLEYVTESTRMRFRFTVLNDSNLLPTQKTYYRNSLDPFIMYYFMDEYPIIRDEIINNNGLRDDVRKKIGMFMIWNHILSFEQVTYETHMQFEGFMLNLGCAEKAAAYVKEFDKLKLEYIRKENEKAPFLERKIKYDGATLYLMYHPQYTQAMTFYYWQDKTRLVYDFPLATSEKICRQFVDILNWVCEEKTNIKVRNDNYLFPLHHFFEYCIKHQIEDLLRMEAKDYIGYRESLVGAVGTKEMVYFQVINMIQKFLFCNEEKVRWDANVWYMERFNLKNDRMNPARIVSRFAFWQICNEDNRELFKGYIKYYIGLTNEAIDTVRTRYYCVKIFLMYCDEVGVSACDIGKDILDSFFTYMAGRDIQAAFFNRIVKEVFRFWKYLNAIEKAEKPRISTRYYLKRVILKHHNLSVNNADNNKVISALRDAPEHIQMIFLNLKTTGIRINEACSIRANTYISDGERYYMRVNQYKMRAEKIIPIPKELYFVMTEYIRRIGKTGDEFVFCKRDGRAYDPGYFSRQVKELLEATGVDRKEYDFRSHGYRHTMATRLHDANVALQVIRDYLGHKSEEMTKQYIDYMDEVAAKVSEDFFKRVGLLNENTD